MISVSELRIGNWVRFKFKIGDIITIKKDYCEIQSDNMIIKSEYNDLEPIPLTPEILEKCGFVDDLVEGQGYEYIITSDYPNDELFLVWNEIGLHVSTNEDALLTTPIKYLHQLQNLYFTLTGEELEVKL